MLILLPGMPEAVQALPAALAAIAAGVIGFWRWQDNWVRFAYTAEALKAERVKFRTRSGEAYRAPLGDERALDNFVSSVENLVLNETAEWRTLLRNHIEAREPE